MISTLFLVKTLDYTLSRSKLGTMPYRLVYKDETAMDYTYKVDKLWPDEEAKGRGQVRMDLVNDQPRRGFRGK